MLFSINLTFGSISTMLFGIKRMSFSIKNIFGKCFVNFLGVCGIEEIFIGAGKLVSYFKN
jgi:Na+/phosphate symporter